jgi:hypothetical protein
MYIPYLNDFDKKLQTTIIGVYDPQKGQKKIEKISYFFENAF